MRTLDSYIDQYGWGGWKTSAGGAQAPIVMMLRDEIATPGSTILSKLDRAGLERAFSTLKGDWQDEQRLANVDMPFSSLRMDGSNVEKITITNPATQMPLIDAAWKANGAIMLNYGEKNNPFTQHTDWLDSEGVVRKDLYIKTDLVALETYYKGAVNATITKQNIFATNAIVTSKEVLTKMLQLVIQNGIDTAANVKQYFGDYSFAPGAADTAIQLETKLPVVPALTDAYSEQLFKGYIAYFGRPADPGGLQFWVDSIKGAGGDVTAMVNNFGSSNEYKNLYAGSTSEEVVNSLYQHLFNRDGEKAGVDFWTGHLKSGALTLSNIAFQIVNSALSTDAVIVAEKVTAARAFTASLDTERELALYGNDTSALNARKWLSAVGQEHTQTVKLIGIANDVINGLQGDVDPILAANGFQAGYY